MAYAPDLNVAEGDRALMPSAEPFGCGEMMGNAIVGRTGFVGSVQARSSHFVQLRVLICSHVYRHRSLLNRARA